MRSLCIMVLLAALAPFPAAAAPTVVAGVTEAWGVAVDSQDNLYVSDSISRVYKVTQSGSVTLLASGLKSPWGLAVDAHDNLFIGLNLDPHTAIDEIPAGTDTVQSFLAVSGPVGGISGVTFDSQGNLYFASGSDGDVFEILQGTTTPITIGEGFFDALGIAVDAGGNIFVSRYTFNEIDEIPASAGRPVSYSGGLVYASGLNGPAGLVFDAAGNLLVSIYGNGSIGTSVDLIPAGSPAPAAATTLVTGLTQPEYLAYRFGNLYIADSSGGGQVLTTAPPIPALSPRAAVNLGLLLAAAGWVLVKRRRFARG